jgi:hypothetical protein
MNTLEEMAELENKPRFWRLNRSEQKGRSDEKQCQEENMTKYLELQGR